MLSEGSQYAFYLAAEHLPPSKARLLLRRLAVQLADAATRRSAAARRSAPNGSLQGGALLPTDAGKYHTMLLTRETSTPPDAAPARSCLRGSFALH